MKKLFLLLLALLFCGMAFAETITTNGGVEIDTADLPYQSAEAPTTVYFIADISPESLVAAYRALGVALPGKVGVKMSTGESERSNYLRAELIGDLFALVDGTIVECNTAYGGSRASTAMHRQQAKDNGLLDMAELDILDEEDSMEIPIEGGTRIQVDYVGSHFANYDAFLVLSHFKGHAMAGFGGAIKNISIGFGSSMGKVWIHSGGTRTSGSIFDEQDPFLEAMGDAAKGVNDTMGDNIVYVSVLNRLSVDCDCDGNRRAGHARHRHPGLHRPSGYRPGGHRPGVRRARQPVPYQPHREPQRAVYAGARGGNRAGQPGIQTGDY